MKKTIALATTLMTFKAFSLGGDIVTDPGSYEYYAQQIKQYEEMLETQMKQWEELKQQVQMVQDTKQKLENAYNKAQEQIDEFQYYADKAKTDPLEFGKYLEDKLSETDRLEQMEKIYESIDEAYKSTDGNPFVHTKKREDMINSASRQMIANAEETKALYGQNMSSYERLLNDANSAGNLKEGQDVTNALLAEILKNQIMANQNTAQYQQMMAMTHYNNYRDELDRVNAEKGMTAEQYREAVSQGMKGLDPEQMAEDNKKMQTEILNKWN